jgi:putative hydrolase of the HAD superfamily
LIKAVFFDWFNTLAVYHPPREELQSKALEEYGFNISPEAIRPALLKADKELFEENAVSSLRLKTPEQQNEMYIRYQKTLLSEVGIDVSGDPGIIPGILAKANELYKDLSFILFDDVIPVMKNLKERELITGLITNIESGMKPICDSLGLGPYLDFTVTSGEAGSDKPQPEIFMLALKRAGVPATEAIHIGDQYRIDAMGARGAGIKPIIIDRNGLYPEITDVPRIRSLDEVFDYL